MISDTKKVAHKRNDLSLLLVLAMLLIVNSHLEQYYPFPWLAGGGLIGNALFLFVSGYGLMKSWSNKKRSFINYYSRRFRRIYPTLIFSHILFSILFLSNWREWAPMDYVRYLILADGYHYIQKVMVFYVVFYVIARQKNNATYFRYLKNALVFLFPLCFYLLAQNGEITNFGSIPPIASWLFYLLVFTLGTIHATGNGNKSFLSSPFWLLLIVPVITFQYYIVKTQSYLLTPVLFLLLTLTLNSFLVTFQQIFNKLPEVFVAITDNLSKYTLEIYIIHFILIRESALHEIVFPINILALLGLSLIGALVEKYFLTRLSDLVKPNCKIQTVKSLSSNKKR
ncbi:acyltransferase family protein [Marinoscillum furvescens]|uniref:Acyltransferase-like protein n=1 Tax=Marinoscillum furvescens DSM 4134 TaxID=1122208 RepID=A0A3D9L1V9_MARFU|nr:acyltransferase family protein [Marinoscillum furvescens]RED96146.1 acyltransferase-like protein [Marinoscillum furvescens DSM 4134]